MDGAVPFDSVILLGDSRMEGLVASAIATNAVNFGVGGDTVLDVLARAENYQCAREASAIVIQAGVNDLFETGSHGPVVERLVKLVQAMPQDVPVFVCEVIPVANGLKVKPEMVEALNLQIRHTFGSMAINMDSLAINGVIRAEFNCGDGLHLNAEGNRKAQQVIARSLHITTNWPHHSTPGTYSLRESYRTDFR